jgi:hypothetical protein
MEIKRAKPTGEVRIQVQSKVRKATFEFLQKEMKKRKCSMSEAIDILLYDLATTLNFKP